MAAIAQQGGPSVPSAAENTGNFLKQAQSNAENALKDAKTQIDGVTGKAKAELQKQYDTVNSGFQNLKGQVNGAVNKNESKYKTK